MTAMAAVVDSPSRHRPGVGARVGHFTVTALEAFCDHQAYYQASDPHGHPVTIRWADGVMSLCSLPEQTALAKELTAASELAHPCLQRPVWFGWLDDAFALASVPIPRDWKTLARMTADAAFLPPSEATRLAATAARLVAVLHEANIAHRHVSPLTLLVSPQGSLGLAAVGWGRLHDVLRTHFPSEVPSPDATTPKIPFDSPWAFAAPEQVYGERVGRRADIYALGAVYFWLLTGVVPPLTANAATPADPRQWRSQIPPACVEILHTALGFAPHERYPTPDAMAAELERALPLLSGPAVASPIVSGHVTATPQTASTAGLQRPAGPSAIPPGSSRSSTTMTRVGPAAEAVGYQSSQRLSPATAEATDSAQYSTAYGDGSLAGTPPHGDQQAISAAAFPSVPAWGQPQSPSGRALPKPPRSYVGTAPHGPPVGARPAKPAGLSPLVVFGLVMVPVVVIVAVLGYLSREVPSESANPKAVVRDTNATPAPTLELPSEVAKTQREFASLESQAELAREFQNAATAQQAIVDLREFADRAMTLGHPLGKSLADQARALAQKLTVEFRLDAASTLPDAPPDTTSPIDPSADQPSPTPTNPPRSGLSDTAPWAPTKGGGRGLNTQIGPVEHLAVSNDGTGAITISSDHTVRLWFFDQNKTVPIVTHTHPITALTISNDDRYVLFGDAQGKLAVCLMTEVTTPKLLGDHQINHAVGALSFSPNGSFVVAGHADGAVVFWGVADRPEAWKGLARFNVKIPVTSLAVSPDNRFLVLGHNNGNMGLMAIDGQPRALKGVKAHTGPITSVKFSRDGRHLVSASEDGTACLWTVGDLAPLLPQRLVPAAPADGSPPSPVVAADWLPDQDHIFTATRNGQLRLWRVADGQLHLERRNAYSDLLTALVTPTGRSIATGTADGYFRVWFISDLLAQANPSTAKSEPAPEGSLPPPQGLPGDDRPIP